MSNSILIVEPNQTINDEMCKRLRSFGFSVESTDSMENARQVAAKHHPDLVVVDHCLAAQANLSELQLDTRWMRDAALVLVADMADMEAVASAGVMGASSVLTQPFSGNDLLDSVSHALWHEQEAANDACYS